MPQAPLRRGFLLALCEYPLKSLKTRQIQILTIDIAMRDIGIAICDI
jgi:hypothetical protein